MMLDLTFNGIPAFYLRKSNSNVTTVRAVLKGTIRQFRFAGSGSSTGSARIFEMPECWSIWHLVMGAHNGTLQNGNGKNSTCYITVRVTQR
jgi:hypothetical protein